MSRKKRNPKSQPESPVADEELTYYIPSPKLLALFDERLGLGWEDRIDEHISVLEDDDEFEPE